MTRRDFLSHVGIWGLGLGLLYPLYAFVVKKRIRPPKIVRIRGKLNPGELLMEPQFALFETKKGPLVLSRRCPHLGCTVNYRELDRQFLCPCHQSRFTWTGKYIAGPAKKDLTRLQVKVVNEGYLIQIPRKVL